MVLRRVLRKGGLFLWGFTVKKGSEKGSQKGFLAEGGFQKVPRTSPQRVRPLRRAPYPYPAIMP